MAAVAIVTGGNKGIGFAIVRALCKKFKGDVYLTARNEGLGQKAVEDLKKEGLNPKFHQLDITDKSSIQKLHSFLQTNYNGLDLLVNNAGMAYKMASTAPFSEQAEMSVKTNFLGTLDVCNILFPLLRPHARVVNVSSMASQMSLSKCSSNVQSKFKNPNLSMDQLREVMQQFVNEAKTENHQKAGFANSAYGMSKVGVTVMSFIQQKQLNAKEDIVLNACCPGYVATDMSSYKGHKTIDEGADTPVYLALLPQGTQSPKGNFVSERKIKQWG